MENQHTTNFCMIIRAIKKTLQTVLVDFVFIGYINGRGSANIIVKIADCEDLKDLYFLNFGTLALIIFY